VAEIFRYRKRASAIRQSHYGCR